MKIQARVFQGMRPARSTDLLAPGEAQFSLNTRLSGGDLEPFRGLATPGAGVTLAAGTKSIYRFGQTNGSEVLYWFQSTLDADFVKGPIDNDTAERTYWTDGVYPKKTDATLALGTPPYPSNSYRMGVPPPATAGSQALVGTPTNPTDPAETILYCMTYVTAWGEESGPSALSGTLQIKPGQSVDFTALPVVPTGTYNASNVNLAGKRIYRSATGSAGTAFQLVNTEGDIAIAATTYSDTKLTAALGETLTTSGWAPPPDTMTGLCAMANGIMAGFTGNTLCFSEPFTPYAWPERYQASTDAPIVGIAAFDQSLFVGTTQGIYVFTGAHPSSMTSDKLPVAQSCVSKRSIVPMLGGVLFASPDGLMKLSSSGLQNLCDGLMTRVEWQLYAPATITAFESDNRYLAFFDTGARTAGMVFSFGDNSTFSEVDTFATAGFRDKQKDGLYLAVGTALQKWDAGTPMTYTWTSGVFHLPYEVNMACARVDASAYPLTFQLYANGAAVGAAISVANGYAFRLPAGYRSMRYHFTLSGTATVREACVATSMREIASN